MTIDRLGESTILVTLMRDDMRRYDLDFEASADAAETRQGLTRLMYRVGEECGLNHRDKSYLVEALPGKESCLLIISVRSGKPRKRYRIKRETTVECCVFQRCDDFLDWLSRPESAALGYSLYALSGCYYLLPTYPLNPAESVLLNEYGAVTKKSPVAAARIREHGTFLREQPDRRVFHFRNASSAAM